MIPANSLASVNGIAMDCAVRKVLGEDVEIVLHTIDETNEYVDYRKLSRMIKKDGGHGLIGLVGVQSNMFPRAMDLAERFRSEGIQVAIGGFHVSGILSMLDVFTPELERAVDAGITLFAGEAEERRLDILLQDAYAKNLKPLYNYLDDMPTLMGQPIPFLEHDSVKRTWGTYGSFDLGRGCPFDCSFCTIINVQGKKSRYRTVDDLEKIIRQNDANGIRCFFLTDDNFTRNKNWEAILERMISLRNEGIAIRLSIQVDTLCHKIPNFIEKCSHAGVDQVFIGLENINAENLVSIKKRQNKINDYKEMILAWKRYPVVLIAGYIIGLPNDTHQSILNDIETIKRELALDMIYFTMITPLPGSEDHKAMLEKGEWMDSDLNKYDLNHRVTHHPIMSDNEWESAYDDAWKTFYTFEHMETVLKRMIAFGSNKKRTTVFRLLFYKEYRRLFALHPLEGGMIRIKRRKERRRGFVLEPVWQFYPKYWYETIQTSIKMFHTYSRLTRMMKKIWTDPQRYDYRDQAMEIRENDKELGSRQL